MAGSAGRPDAGGSQIEVSPMRHLLALLALALFAVASPAVAASAGAIARDSKATLDRLYAANAKARDLGARARAVLIFPKIVKAGFVVGGQTGEGALIENGQATKFYNISAGSFGLQAGAQTFSYALFFITDSSLDFLKKRDGWSVGTGPSVVIVDEGFAKSMTSTTLTQDVYAVPFGNKGLMAGTGLEGSKITQIYPNP
jgi:lipid-binding SYLF domain-containing protein